MIDFLTFTCIAAKDEGTWLDATKPNAEGKGAWGDCKAAFLKAEGKGAWGD